MFVQVICRFGERPIDAAGCSINVVMCVVTGYVLSLKLNVMDCLN